MATMPNGRQQNMVERTAMTKWFLGHGGSALRFIGQKGVIYKLDILAMEPKPTLKRTRM